MVYSKTRTKGKTMQSVIQTLKKTRSLLEKPNAWTQNTYAKDSEGCEVPILSNKAVCFCVLGAIRKVTLNYATEFEPATNLLSLVLEIEYGKEYLYKFNDAQDSVGHVLDLLDKAIKFIDKDLSSPGKTVLSETLKQKTIQLTQQITKT